MSWPAVKETSLSKIFKNKRDAFETWNPGEVNARERLRGRRQEDQEAVFESTGFLSGMEACTEGRSVEEIIGDAKQRADEIARKAYEQGFAQGETAGFEFGNKKAESVAKELLSVISDVRNLRQEVLAQAERQAVTLAMRLAEKIIAHEISLQEETILHVARAALQLAAGQDRLRIVLHPEDHQFWINSGDALPGALDGMSDVTLETDPNIRRGGCLIQTEFGEINAEVDRKIALVFGALTDQVTRATAGE